MMFNGSKKVRPGTVSKKSYEERNEKMQKRKRVGKFWNYCKQICRQSLITGFPVIISTRSPTRKVVKLSVFLLCMCGFLYQTTDFLNMYLTYDTMVDIQVSYPDTVQLPAISVCNKNRLLRTKICTTFKKDCLWKYKKREEFCFVLPKYCIYYYDDEDIVMAELPITKYTKLNRTFEYTEEFGQQIDDLIGSCILRTNRIRKCKNYVRVLATDTFGYPNNCYAIESLWLKPEAEAQKIPVTAKYHLILTMHPEEYVKHSDLVQAHVALHDPFSIINPMMEGLMLVVGKSYNIYISETRNYRLSSPYLTNCTDYLKLWRENGGQGPLNGKACQEKCKMEVMLEEIGCVPQSITYPNAHHICTANDIFPSEEVIEKCSKECSEACEDSRYELRVEVSEDLTVKCENGDLNCMYEKVILHFIFSRFQSVAFVHEPKFANVELFSYIGGYMGMWLGISLVALFDFVETIFYLLSYPLKTWFSSQKKFTRQVNRNFFYDM